MRAVPSLVLALSLFSVACSSSSGNDAAATCASFAPCGGDLQGTWTFQDACTTSTPPAACSDMTIASTSTVGGSLTFNADGTFGGATTQTPTIDAHVPQHCLAGKTCSSLQASLTADPSVSTASCTGASDCDCHAVYKPQTSSGSGTWSASGSTLTMHTSTGTSTLQYCVRGNTLLAQATGNGVTTTLVATH